MSKRYIFPQQYNEKKKPRLDVTISDHNFPLSQNQSNKEEKNQGDTWGDENDDEILLLASQACEDAYVNDISNIPDYSLCMNPGSTSTQITDLPSTSKGFIFKKPSSHTNTNKDSHNKPSNSDRSSKIISNPGQINFSDDIILNDKMYQGLDSEQIYRQMMQLQEENLKLKSEKSKLLEKCVTKEGEASILRNQLKTCQVSLDNVRMEKLKAQEKMQIDWNDKLLVANNQLKDLRTQLDFKNLEVISTKEKCKMLESSKVKLTQVTVAGNDVSFSQRCKPHFQDSFGQARKIKQTSNFAQTDNKMHFNKLNILQRTEKSKLKEMIPLLLQETKEPISFLDYNEKLHRPPRSHNDLEIYSMLDETISPPTTSTKKCTLKINCVYEDLSYLSSALEGGDQLLVQDKFCNILDKTIEILNSTITQLETVSNRMTAAFQREMDEKYIQMTNTYLCISDDDLLSGVSLYKEEEAILTRRMTAVLSYTIKHTNKLSNINSILKNKSIDDSGGGYMEHITKICNLLDSTSCAIMFSTLLLSIINLLDNLLFIYNDTKIKSKVLEITKLIISSRPLPVVLVKILILIRKLATPSSGPLLCTGNSNGNLKTDYDQGVLIYKKDSCGLQVLLKSIETTLKCMEKQGLYNEIINTTSNLISLQFNTESKSSSQNQKKCNCDRVMFQVKVYSLHMCSHMLKNCTLTDSTKSHIYSICHTGVLILYQWVMKDVEFSSQLGYNEGHYHLFIENCDDLKDEIGFNQLHLSMLTELLGTLQITAEDVDLPNSEAKLVWLESFSNFSIEK